jgi:outer membrane protein TolC
VKNGISGLAESFRTDAAPSGMRIPHVIENRTRLGSHGWALAAVILSLPSLATAAPFTIEDAIRATWKQNPAIASSAEMVAAARADADSARDGRLPSVLLSAKAVATNEPMSAFGLKLDEQRITAADFDPNRLNSPASVGGVGLGATVMQPIYMGGRLTAARRAASAQAEAETCSHDRRRQEMALQVVQAYFGAQVAAEGLKFAEDVLAQARETESFTRSRNQQGLALDADLARATAFRAQAEAESGVANQRLGSARSMLVLLAGEQAAMGELSSVLVADALSADSTNTDGQRADLKAAELRAEAARAMVAATRGGLLPEVMAQATLETMRSDFNQGATWYTLGLVARWRLSVTDLRATEAASLRAAAAEDTRRWQGRQAAFEVDEAQRALQSARSRGLSAREAVTASESARSLRLARHRQGLLPLTEVLDAETGLAGARALLLRNEYDARVAAAQLQFAFGKPIEGVRP